MRVCVCVYINLSIFSQRTSLWHEPDQAIAAPSYKPWPLLLLISPSSLVYCVTEVANTVLYLLTPWGSRAGVADRRREEKKITYLLQKNYFFPEKRKAITLLLLLLLLLMCRSRFWVAGYGQNEVMIILMERRLDFIFNFSFRIFLLDRHLDNNNLLNKK